MNSDIPTMEPTTIGMRIDNILEQMNHLSSTQLYMFFVTVMAIAAVLILSPAGTSNDDDNVVTDASMIKKPSTTNVESTRNRNSSNRKPPAPAIYGYLRMINFIFTACFLASLVAFFNNAGAYSSSAPILYRFLLGWSAYLAYFFSFAGVTLMYDLDQETVAVSVTNMNCNTLSASNNVDRYVFPSNCCISHL